MSTKWNFSNNRNFIDLRKELNGIFNGTKYLNQMGYWVIYRRFDLNSKSIYYNELTREGVGGPKYNYTDELVLTYKWNNFYGDPFSEQQISAGMIHVPLLSFFFEYTLNPKEEDEIYEFDWSDHTTKPVLSEIEKPYKTKYNIRNVLEFRLDQGRIEYFICRAMKENVQI